MVEKDLSQGGSSPDRVLNEDKGNEVKKDSQELVASDPIDKDELVGYEPTNPLHNYTIFNKLILLKQTNIILKELRESYPVIVGRWETIIQGDKALEVVSLMCEKQVFAIPTIIHNFSEPYKQAKPYVYEIVKALEIEGLLVRTPYKVVKPDPSKTGPKPFFYMWSHLNLDAWNDSRLKNAQKEYNEVTVPVAKSRNSVKQSVNDILIAISREATDYYRQRSRIGKNRPPQKDVGQYLKSKHNDLPDHERSKLAQIISHNLYKEGQTDRTIAEIESEKADREEALKKILEVMKPPIKQLTPLYDKLDDLGIKDTESRAYIRNYFIDRAKPNASAEEVA